MTDHIPADRSGDPPCDWERLETQHPLLRLPLLDRYTVVVQRLETRDLDQRLRDVCWYLAGSATDLGDHEVAGPMPEIAVMAEALGLTEDTILDELAWLQIHGALWLSLRNDAYRLRIMVLPAKAQPTTPPPSSAQLDWGDMHGMGAL